MKSFKPGKLVFLVILFLTSLALLCLFSLRSINPGRTALMKERGGAIRQSWVPLSAISRNLTRAVIVAEDASFYQHWGVDFREMRESLRKNMKKKRYARGGSTITMQLTRNLFLSPKKSLIRKVSEVLIACAMERILSKNRILEIYLNVIEWGNGVYGVEAAASYYFHKPASSLSASEAAFLASIIPNPRKWGHWPPGSYIQRRQQVILARMWPSQEKKEEEFELPELPEEPTETK